MLHEQKLDQKLKTESCSGDVWIRKLPQNQTAANAFIGTSVLWQSLINNCKSVHLSRRCERFQSGSAKLESRQNASGSD